ncbi:MAG: permease-like cell division protein FtsX, partial [Syntrophomonadaceae bacterium]|nr:permease-like cell division protein FtsX [Syntrophomonadaceae bacterium]
MRVNSWGYFFRQAAASVRRNGWMSIASIITMTFCLMVLGSALLILLNTSSLVASIESNVEIIAYVNSEVEAQSLPALQQRLQGLDEVEQVTFISKEEALEDLR